ncbi:MAG: hypothetical protein F7B60_03105, partial [Desulfurococcales archaeon]|nr:hypothetical protein [Desulfurococcales archaeon]
SDIRFKGDMKFKIGKLLITGHSIKETTTNIWDNLTRRIAVLLERKKAILYYAHPMIFYGLHKEREIKDC